MKIDVENLKVNLEQDIRDTAHGCTTEYAIGSIDGAQIQIVVTRDPDRMIDAGDLVPMLYCVA